VRKTDPPALKNVCFAKIVVAAVLPSGVVIAWLAYAAVTATTQLFAAAT
jgi:hypothetical protein